MPVTPKAEIDTMSTHSLDLCEFFVSISGEGSHAGSPAIFLRTAGCNLRCTWCDTSRAWGDGKRIERGKVLDAILAQLPRLVILTGGEPLQQTAIPWLAQELIRAGRRVSVETNGSLDIEILPPGAHVVLDIKAPSSGEMDKMDFDNLTRLQPGDDLKFIIADRQDFDWVCQLLELRTPANGVNIFVSCAFQLLEAATLATWLIESGLAARLQLQLHRYLWPEGGEAMPLPLPE